MLQKLCFYLCTFFLSPLSLKFDWIGLNRQKENQNGFEWKKKYVDLEPCLAFVVQIIPYQNLSAIGKLSVKQKYLYTSEK